MGKRERERGGGWGGVGESHSAVFVHLRKAKGAHTVFVHAKWHFQKIRSKEK